MSRSANQRPLGIYSKPDSTFYANGLETDPTYEITAQTTRGPHQFIGVEYRRKCRTPYSISHEMIFPAGRRVPGGVYPPDAEAEASKVGDAPFTAIRAELPTPPSPPKRFRQRLSQAFPASDGNRQFPANTVSRKDLARQRPQRYRRRRLFKPENTAEGQSRPERSRLPVNITTPGDDPAAGARLLPLLPGDRSTSNPQNTGQASSTRGVQELQQRSCDLLPPRNSGGVVLVEFHVVV